MQDMVPIPVADVLGIAARLERAGKTADAENLLDRVLAVHPRHAEALHLKGIAASTAGRDAEAVGFLERAIEFGLEHPQYYRNICASYERLGRLEEALAAGRRAVALDATDAESYHNLTVVHAKRLELDAAIENARMALSLDPQRPGAHLALAEALLIRGDLAEGFREYEWRYRIAGAAAPLPKTDRPQWDGAPMPAHRLLLVADQGFGDVIQFCRYIPWVRSLCPDVVIACAAEMQDLVRQVAPQVPIFNKWNECPPYAAFVPLSGLPRLHGTLVETIPAEAAYMRAAPERVASWRNRLLGLIPPGHRGVALVWAGRAEHANDRSRSVRLAQLRPVLDTPRMVFFAVQKGPPLVEAGRYFGRAPLINLGASIMDFTDTAAILSLLDLTLTVDTSVAHLAGALGRPAWVMLPYAPDWRWLLNRRDSPWYPSVTLFRQTQPGDWAGVANAVAAALPGFESEMERPGLLCPSG